MVKKNREFYDNESENIAVRVNPFVVVEQFTTFSQFRCLRAPAWKGKPLPHLKQETSCVRK